MVLGRARPCVASGLDTSLSLTDCKPTIYATRGDGCVQGGGARRRLRSVGRPASAHPGNAVANDKARACLPVRPCAAAPTSSDRSICPPFHRARAGHRRAQPMHFLHLRAHRNMISARCRAPPRTVHGSRQLNFRTMHAVVNAKGAPRVHATLDFYCTPSLEAAWWSGGHAHKPCMYVKHGESIPQTERKKTHTAIGESGWQFGFGITSTRALRNCQRKGEIDRSIDDACRTPASLFFSLSCIHP